MAGAAGGSKCEESSATAENGEDTYVRCPSCGYAANVEAVRVLAPDERPWRDAVPAAHRADLGQSHHRHARGTVSNQRYSQG